MKANELLGDSGAMVLNLNLFLTLNPGDPEIKIKIRMMVRSKIRHL